MNRQTDVSQLENFMRDHVKQVWGEDLIVEDMETEQIWYQLEDYFRQHVGNHLEEELQEDAESEDIQGEQDDAHMEEENIDEDNDGESNQSNIEDEYDENDMDEEAMGEEGMEEEDVDEEDENGEDGDENHDEKNESPDQENHEDDNSKEGQINKDGESFNEYDFNEEEYNQFLDEMDEQDLNEDQDEKDEEEAEMEEEDDEEGEDNEENKAEDDAEEDDEDAEDVFRTLAYGTHEKNFDHLEQKLIEKKSWQLRGEIRAQDREKNTLLEEDLEFQRGMQTKTKINKETNSQFESIIKQRILDLAFDDRSSSTYFNKPVVTEQVKNLPELDFEKDKRGLAGIYEDQYKKKVMGIDEKKSKDDTVKDQIKDLYRLICFSIDNMTRFQYNPSVIPLADKKATNGFIIDEKIPIVVSGDLLKDRKSYKDVHNPKDKEMMSKAEMTKEEKVRLRRRIKRTMKVKNDNRKQKEIERTGMKGSDYKILEKNQSKVKKQIQDSKSSGAAKFTRKSEFFSTIAKNSS